MAILKLSSALLLAGALVESVIAHGFVPQIKIGNQYIPGWNVNTGQSHTPPFDVFASHRTRPLILQTVIPPLRYDEPYNFDECFAYT